MKKLVDNLNSITGWTGSGAGITAPSANEIPDFIAGLTNTSSLVLKWDSGNLNGSIEKTVNIDVSDYTELIFHIWSRNKKQQGENYNLTTDFAYKLNLGGSKNYHIPTTNRFDAVTIDISDVSTISKIKFTALHNDEDYIIVSYMVAAADQFPLDIFSSLKEHLDYEIGLQYGRVQNGTLDKGILY